MKNDVMHPRVQEGPGSRNSRIQDGPVAHRPKAKSENECDGGLVLDKDRSRIQLEPQILENLVRNVKETVATDIKFPKKVKRFSVVNLWNLRRNRRYRAQIRKQPAIHTGIRG
jgi:hypothetical protein